MIKHVNNKIQNAIQTEIFKAKESIKIAVAWFTNELLLQPLVLKLKEGVSVEIIINNDEINHGGESSLDFTDFLQAGGILRWNNSKQLTHEKFCIIDNRIVITGSYNWTKKAEYNSEVETFYYDEKETIQFFTEVFENLSSRFKKEEYEEEIVINNNKNRYPKEYYWEEIDNDKNSNKNIKYWIVTALSICIILYMFWGNTIINKEEIVVKEGETSKDLSILNENNSVSPKSTKGTKEIFNANTHREISENKKASKEIEEVAEDFDANNQVPSFDTEERKEIDQKIFDVVEQAPQFNGNLMQYLNDNIQYPVVAEENGMQGRVIVQFIVECDGSITDVKVVRSVDPALDKEAIRVVKSMPKWNSGKLNGKPVRVRFTLPILFRLG